jgi:hypothetical protein
MRSWFFSSCGFGSWIEFVGAAIVAGFRKETIPFVKTFLAYLSCSSFGRSPKSAIMNNIAYHIDDLL